MQYIITVFSGRQGAMAFYDQCIRTRLAADIINTPRELGAGCGISVRTAYRTLGMAQAMGRRLPTYVGTYLVTQTMTHRTVVRL